MPEISLSWRLARGVRHLAASLHVYLLGEFAMANINVSYQEINSNADRLVAGRDEINATLGKLQSQIAALISSGFSTDKSSGAFSDAYNRFTTGAQNTIGGLDDLSLFLRTTAQTLGEVDAQLAARLSR
ncbi:WXG100 family type VII secretion target [Cryobacterium sp. N22]|nr:WXG100 family type VII secretion target [Cryobacterium sp. N22]